MDIVKFYNCLNLAEKAILKHLINSEEQAIVTFYDLIRGSHRQYLDKSTVRLCNCLRNNFPEKKLNVNIFEIKKSELSRIRMFGRKTHVDFEALKKDILENEKD